MDIRTAIEGLDKLFNEHRENEIEQYLAECIMCAIEEDDSASVLVLLNEMVGFMRDSNQYEKSLIYADKAVKLIEDTGLTNTIHHGTTLINQANAMRAAGLLDESVNVYKQADSIYGDCLEASAFDFASLYNNMSLVFMEQGDYKSAVKHLEKALDIAINYPEKGFEIAVTHANLGNSYIGLDSDNLDKAKALEHLNKAIEYFENNDIKETHYAAAIMGVGDIKRLEGNIEEALELYEKAMTAAKYSFGYTDSYYRVKEKYDDCLKLYRKDGGEVVPSFKRKGIDVCRDYYINMVKPAILKECPEAMPYITAGLIGPGSECFGLDDVESRDHDWGPSVCVFLDDENYEKYAEKLKEIYSKLPNEYMGYKRQVSEHGNGRVGVLNTRNYVNQLLGNAFGTIIYEAVRLGGSIRDEKGNRQLDTMYLSVPEDAFACITNGELFEVSKNSMISRVREELMKGYPLHLKYLKLAEAFAKYSQNLQYNLRRMLIRRDMYAVRLMLNEGVKQVYEIAYLLNDKYKPHDKWLHGYFKKLSKGRTVYMEDVEFFLRGVYEEFDSLIYGLKNSDVNVTESLLKPLLDKINRLAEYILDEARLAMVLTIGGYENPGYYLEDQTAEFSKRAGFCDLSKELLVETVVRLEWEAFDKVINEGGRASCQDNFNTFSLMRRSQYNTWNFDMLVQYATDFSMAKESGWNLITEKYGRMEESTSPERWEELKDKFPPVPESKLLIIEQIVALQVKWTEEFAEKYPKLQGNARSIHTEEDNEYNTSSETYLRGELMTYSDTMLKMYGAFIVSVMETGGNLARMITEQTVLQYGYKNLDDAESKL